MPYARRLKAVAILPLIVLCAGCVRTVVANDVPPCERLIHPSLLAPTPPPEQPVSRQLADGHDDAEPWQSGFIGAIGQLEKANEKPAAVDWTYRECLKMHAAALKRSKGGFFSRLF